MVCILKDSCCGVTVYVGLEGLSADFGELSGGPRGPLVAPLLPLAAMSAVLCCCYTGSLHTIPAAGMANCSLSPSAKARLCCWQSAVVGERPRLRQALLSRVLPPH